RIADFVYEKLTGEKGVFSTRIAYVVKRGSRFELQIADADGAGEEAALVSFEPIISPAWSPDGRKLAYVSFENKKPVVYVHSLVDGKRNVIANFRGSNSAPAWSPDGRRLAVTLSREGGSQIFLLNADGSGLRRLTSSAAIDTEPRFSGDGQWIYFTSDRGGSPQIYRMPAAGGEPQRVTFEGSYTVTARLSPDGKPPGYITVNEGTFQVARLDRSSRPAAGSPLKDPNNILSRRSIYFDFDKFDIKDEFRPLVEAHAKYLRENPGAKMLIQGNADERGSREYNLGLGQRRSDSVKRALTI